MDVSGPKLPLSAVYLNLLQARPVNPVPPVARTAISAPAGAPAGAAARPGDAAAASPAAATTGGSNRPTRGRLIDIVV